MTTEPKRRRGKYKAATSEWSVEDALKNYSEIQELTEEMESWRDNLQGTGLESTGKFSEVEEAADTLANSSSECESQVDGVVEKIQSFAPSLLEEKVSVILQVTRSKRKSPSRAVRLSNATASIGVARDHLVERLDQIKILISDGEEHTFFPDLDETGFSPEMKTQVNEDIEEIEGYLDGIEDIIGDLEGVEFPGMFG